MDDSAQFRHARQWLHSAWPFIPAEYCPGNGWNYLRHIVRARELHLHRESHGFCGEFRDPNITLHVLAGPVAQVNQPLVPGSSVPGGAAFMLTLNGTGFDTC